MEIKELVSSKSGGRGCKLCGLDVGSDGSTGFRFDLRALGCSFPDAVRVLLKPIDLLDETSNV